MLAELCVRDVKLKIGVSPGLDGTAGEQRQRSDETPTHYSLPAKVALASTQASV